MGNAKDKNYVFSTSINSSESQDEFLIELFSCSEEDTDQEKPAKVIHDFDELITFFEGFDQDNDLNGHNKNLISQKVTNG